MKRIVKFILLFMLLSILPILLLDEVNDNWDIKRALQKLWFGMHPIEAPAEESLIEVADAFFQALQCGDMDEATKYSTKFGLGTIMYPDMEDITSYEFVNCKLYRRSAFIQLKLNNLDKLIPLYFEKHRNKWRFHGIDVHTYFRDKPRGFYFRRKLHVHAN